jgi:catalase
VTQDFVRYSPDIEHIDPTFDDDLRTVIEATQRYIAGSRDAQASGMAVRDAHAKGYGLARGEVEILDGTPAAYAQGTYARPGRHEALVRFSNGSAHTGPDARLGNVVGMGVKILGIEGPTLLEDEPDSGTFDYVLINHPIFFANTVKQYT